MVTGSLWDGTSSVRPSIRPSTNTCNFFSKITHTISMKLYYNVHHRVCTKGWSKHLKNNLHPRWSLRRGVAPQNMHFLSSQKLHTQFWWNLTTTFITRDVLKFIHDIKNNWDLRSSMGVGVLPQNMYLLFFRNHTHNFVETSPHSLSHVMYQSLFTALKIISIGIYFLLR